MPCYRCAARQSDPARGASAWKRGVRSGEQVLICPTCQRQHDWVADLDRCASCGSPALVRQLGQTVCRACGAVDNTTQGGTPDTGPPSEPTDAALSGEIAAALNRLFHREAGR